MKLGFGMVVVGEVGLSENVGIVRFAGRSRTSGDEARFFRDEWDRVDRQKFTLEAKMLLVSPK